MLILRRKKNESILIGDNVRITVIECAPDGVRLAIDAPKSVSILREELAKAEQENKESISPNIRAVASLQNGILASVRKKRTQEN
jgi:carbon storage regulator